MTAGAASAIDVLCVTGSPRCPSRTAALVTAITEALERRSIRCEVWSLAERPVLARAVGQSDRRTARGFAGAVASADALVLGSPVYHNSCSGLIKAALDELTAELDKKPVALASSAASGRSAHALDHLRLVVRALGGIAIPAQVISWASDHDGPADGYRLRDGDARRRAAVVADELVWLGGLLADSRSPPAPNWRRAQALEPAR